MTKKHEPSIGVNVIASEILRASRAPRQTASVKKSLSKPSAIPGLAHLRRLKGEEARPAKLMAITFSIPKKLNRWRLMRTQSGLPPSS